VPASSQVFKTTGTTELKEQPTQISALYETTVNKYQDIHMPSALQMPILSLLLIL
jgi:hypothetical protein